MDWMDACIFVLAPCSLAAFMGFLAKGREGKEEPGVVVVREEGEEGGGAIWRGRGERVASCEMMQMRNSMVKSGSMN